MLLAIDTSTRQIGLALHDGSGTVKEAAWTSPFHHTIELAPAVLRILEAAGVHPEDLLALGVAIGPGSFTALRTGLAFAKGMSLARKTPLVGIPSLDITAAGQTPSGLPLLAVLEAGRTRLAAGRYIYSEDHWEPAGGPELFSLEELAESLGEPTLVCGELSAQAREKLGGYPHARLSPASSPARRPGDLAALAWDRFSEGNIASPEKISPIYLSTAGIDC